MYLSLSLLRFVFALRAYLALPEAGSIEDALESIEGREYWVLADPRRPSLSARAAQERGALGFRVLIERGLESEIPAWVETVGASLSDERGWRSAGRELVQVTQEPRFTVLLAQPETVDRLCRPLRTAGIYSCGRGGRAALNLMRWRSGASPWGGELEGYRVYMINHEVGHLLGMPHQRCHEPDAAADVMVQQTKGLGGCTASAWPSSAELKRLRRRWGQR